LHITRSTTILYTKNGQKEKYVGNEMAHVDDLVTFEVVGRKEEATQH
jgi:hypothetical protein